MPVNQWTLRATDERQAKMERLRDYLHRARIDGERIHGSLTTAQILDWSIDALLAHFEPVVITAATSTNPKKP